MLCVVGDQSDSSCVQHGGSPGLISVNVASNGVATVFLDSVTMPPKLFVACGKVFRALSEDPLVKVVVVRAGTSKPHFSYGLDLKQVMESRPASTLFVYMLVGLAWLSPVGLRLVACER